MQDAMPPAVERRDVLLAQRTRAGLWLILATIGFFALADLGLPPDRLAPAYALKAINAALVLALLPLAHRATGHRALVATALVALNGTFVLVAAGDVVKNHVATTPLLCLTCTMAAAALLPWGVGAQLVTAAITTIGDVVVLLLSGHGWGKLADPVASMIAAQGVAVFVALQFARFREERRRTEQALVARADGERVRAEARVALCDPGSESVRLVRCARAIADGLPVTAVMVLTATEDGRLVPRAMAGLDHDAQRVGERLAGHRLLRGVLTTRTALTTTLVDLGLGGADTLPTMAVAAFPLLVGDDVHGLLVLLGDAPVAPMTVDAARDLAEVLAAGIAQARVEEARNRLLAELDRANRIKSEFVSTMSHELRTPLNVISGYADMLEDPGYPDPAFALARIRQANTELLQLVEATLDLNRLESGRDEPSVAEVALADLWADLAQEFTPAARAAGVRLAWGPATGVVLRTDRRKLRTLVKNLVDNALKFTPAGEVAIDVHCHGARCVLVVRDTGIGIAPSALPHIFEMFKQVDSSDRRSYRGVGLGLHIVQRLCRQLDAEIAVASEVGHGTTFTVTLPLAGPAIRAA